MWRAIVQRSRVSKVAITAALLCFLGSAGLAQDWAVARKYNGWGRFGEGTWVQTRVVSETLGEQGQVTGASTTGTKMTLVRSQENCFTLRTESTVEVAGKKFDTPATTTTEGYYGAGAGERAVITPLEDVKITIEGKAHNCKRQRIEIQGAQQKRVIDLYYNDEIEPHLLRRVVTATDAQDETIYTTTYEVLAVGMPHKVLSEIKSTAVTRTVHKTSKGTTSTLAVHCSDVPGGIASFSSKEVDKTGRLIRHSTMELVEFDVVAAAMKRAGVGRWLKRRREMRRLRWQ